MLGRFEIGLKHQVVRVGYSVGIDGGDWMGVYSTGVGRNAISGIGKGKLGLKFLNFFCLDNNCLLY